MVKYEIRVYNSMSEYDYEKTYEYIKMDALSLGKVLKRRGKDVIIYKHNPSKIGGIELIWSSIRKKIQFKNNELVYLDKRFLIEHNDYGYYFTNNQLIHYFNDRKEFERSKMLI